MASGALLLTTTTPAAADPAPVIQRSASGVTADALPTVQINGVVWDQVVVGDTVYVAGQFTSARPAGSPAGTNETPRANMLAYNIRTGALITSFAPSFNGQVKQLAVSPDKTRLYAAGSFTQVNGQNRFRLASFTVASGALTTWGPAANSGVNGIAVTNTAVYAAGAFSKIGSVDRLRLAAFHPTTGALLAWAPTADATAQSILPTPDGSRIIVAGAFGTLNGATAQGLGAIDAVSASSLPWAANTVVRNYGSSAAMLRLRTDGETIYAVGYWFGGPGNFEGVLAAEPNSGNVKWLADCHGDTYDVAPMNDQVYAVSHWHHCENAGGYPDTNPRNTWYYANAMSKAATGTVRTNNQGGYYDFGGYPAPTLVNWYPTFTVGSFTGQSQATWSTTSTSEYLLVGGEFPTVNGAAQQGLVRFAIPSIAPKKQGPRVAGAAFNPTLVAARPTEVRINWQANHDRDDNTLTYDVFRSGTTAPISTTTSTNQFWNRPAMQATDSGLTPGQTYRYRVAARDPDGNTVLSEFVSITTPTSVAPYVTAVLDDGASNYWRMNSSGTSQVDYAGSTNQTNAGTTTTAGAITGDDALSFPGSSSGQSGTTTAITGPGTFTAEAWFNTTTSSGGKIVGFGGNSTGTSGSYDRHVYLNNAGQVIFGVYPGSIQTITSPRAYNDGQWHHVTASLSANGMELYLDGVRVGTNANTGAQPYSGFWRIGGDNLNAWTDRPGSDFFNGAIDEVAIYPTALSAAQVRNHYTSTGRTVDVPAAPSDTYGSAVYADEPALYWRLNDTGGPTAVDVSPNQSNGTYSGGVSYRTASPVADPAFAATFDGGSGTVGSNQQFSSPSNYTEEIWFKTSTTGGGKLIGFGNAREGGSTSYDRHVYMENDGRLNFGTYTGQANLATSPNSYNDGRWHHLVASQSSTDGMKLYVDGFVVATNGQTQAEPYSGYWRVGGDSSWCCNDYFAGDLDEAAIYTKVLTPAQVLAHYRASAAATNAAPVARFTSDCSAATCTFDSSDSSDQDGSIASRSWDFGDGTTSTSANPTKTYAESGSYTVVLTVTDDKGGTDTETQTVTATVPANVPPTAAFTPSCTALACNFDATASADSDGTIASYAWDFGDGTPAGSGATASHTYAAADTYTVTLTVTDDDGATATKTATVTVAPAPNTAPVAAYTVACTQLECEFDGTGSSDQDGSIVSYLWDFGDGDTSTVARPTHAFDTADTYAVKLTVTDNRGGSTSITKNVTVTVPPPNQAPSADFSSSCSNLVCSFNSGASSDADGTIQSRAWTFGPAGATSNQANPSYTYPAAGTYSVTLTVTDDDGATDTETKSITVTAPAAGPIAADNFGRTASRWGNADTGGTYTYAGSTFATNGTTGTIRVATAGASATAYLPVSARDVNVVADFSVDKVATGGGTFNSFIVRRVGTTDYRLAYKQNANNTVTLTISRTVSGTSTVLRQVNLTGTYAAGDTFRVRFTVTGNGTTTLNAKAWKVGTPEPAAPQATVTDTTAALQAAGSFGIVSYVSGTSNNTPVTTSVDNLLITAP